MFWKLKEAVKNEGSERTVDDPSYELVGVYEIVVGLILLWVTVKAIKWQTRVFTHLMDKDKKLSRLQLWLYRSPALVTGLFSMGLFTYAIFSQFDSGLYDSDKRELWIFSFNFLLAGATFAFVGRLLPFLLGLLASFLVHQIMIMNLVGSFPFEEMSYQLSNWNSMWSSDPLLWTYLHLLFIATLIGTIAASFKKPEKSGVDKN